MHTIWLVVSQSTGLPIEHFLLVGLLVHWKKPCKASTSCAIVALLVLLVNPVLIPFHCSAVCVKVWGCIYSIKEISTLYAASNGIPVMWHLLLVLPPERTLSPADTMCSTMISSEHWTIKFQPLQDWINDMYKFLKRMLDHKEFVWKQTSVLQLGNICIPIDVLVVPSNIAKVDYCFLGKTISSQSMGSLITWGTRLICAFKIEV